MAGVVEAGGVGDEKEEAGCVDGRGGVRGSWFCDVSVGGVLRKRMVLTWWYPVKGVIVGVCFEVV